MVPIYSLGVPTVLLNESLTPVTDPEVEVPVLVAVPALDHVPVGADHGSLLEPGSLGTGEHQAGATGGAHVVLLKN